MSASDINTSSITKKNQTQDESEFAPKHRTLHLSSRSLVSCGRKSSDGWWDIPYHDSTQLARSPRFWSRLVNKLWYFRMFEILSLAVVLQQKISNSSICGSLIVLPCIYIRISGYPVSCVRFVGQGLRMTVPGCKNDADCSYEAIDMTR